MSKGATRCRKCKPTYERTDAHRAAMSAALKGKPKPHLRGRKRPAHSKVMREWWTPERREARRQEMLKRNPLARYHGLSCRGARRIREAAGQCEACGVTQGLDVYHRNRDKRDQNLGNLVVLCRQCHMKTHAKTGETGWQAYHAKRKTIPS